MQGFQQAGIRFSVVDLGGEVHVVAAGVIDGKDSAQFLRPYFRTLHRRIVERSLGSVIFDLRLLEYVNSAAMSCVLAWVKDSRDLAASAYRIRVLFEPDSTWQPSFVKSLVAMAPDVVEAA